MKRVLVIIDGASDVEAESLGGRTPLEAAFAPTLHHLAARGRVGRMETTFEEYPVESMVCCMGLLGYPPAEFYPGGRSAFEAMALGIPLNEDDLIFRCNLITTEPGPGRLVDFTADMISDATARRALYRIQLPDPRWELFPGQSYRNVLILRNSGILPGDIECAAPHMHIGESALDLLPRGRTPAAEAVAARVRDFLVDSHAQLSGSGRAAGSAANMLWVWSPARPMRWPSFADRYGQRAGIVGGLNFLHGIAMAADIHFDRIPGATGYLDTDYEAKLNYTLRYLNEFDLVVLHVNAADEAAHMRDPALKTKVLETIDARVLGPLVSAMRERYADGFRLLVCPDHTTRSDDGRHTRDTVPYILYGHGIEASGTPLFCERTTDGAPVVAPLQAMSMLGLDRTGAT